ncbi:MAG: endonuclease [Crocinitomicaceae bacterium]|nr:endonuclease [Crocinitomicaceae bacterium]
MKQMNVFTRICMIALPIIWSPTIFGQAILPTAWNFDVAAPEGWSESLGASNTRYLTGQTGQACRLDATSDYVLVQFAEEPGALSYYLKGQNSGGTWQGTFTVQQSADGVNYTPLHSFVDAAMNTSSPYVQFTDNPLSTTRYIRFYFTNKVSGHHVALDEISVAIPTAGPEQEINISQGGNNIPSGFTYSVGNAVSTVFTIENLGLVNTLNISSVVISGSDAGEFDIPSFPPTVSANSTGSFTLNFTNNGSGSRFCTISITSDDSSEGVYVINIYAVAGSLATEPTAQATNLTFPNLVSWDYNVSFSNGSPAAEKYLILRRKGSSVASTPIDGTSYAKGEWIGSSQVVYSGSAGSFNARSVEAGTAYHFAIYSFNGPSGYENYLTNSPLTGTVTTSASNPGTFYNGVNHNNPDFVDQLNDALNPSNYSQIFYSNYISTLINNFYVKDTAIAGVAMNAVECEYSGENYVYPAGFQWWSGSGLGTLSREHSYPQSWMPTYFESDFEDRPEVSDLHNLFPVLQVECNAVRSNYPYGDVTDPTSTYLETAYGENSIGQNVYEPRNTFKGDVARAVMYHALKNNKAGEDFSLPEQISLIIPYGQDELLLKKWHFQDLPDNYEKARNEYIQSQQHNRNAFIDSVLFPCFIRFSNLTKWEPLFTNNNGALHAVDAGISYQWYLDGSEIEGATSPDYSATANGDYSLSVRQFTECPAVESQPLTVILNGVVEMTAHEFSVSFYPNPSNGSVRMRLSSAAGIAVQLKITDTVGKLVYVNQYNASPGESVVDISHDLTAGIYTAEITAGNERRTERMVVR